jgi:6-phosphogluconate dehydrogenase
VANLGGKDLGLIGLGVMGQNLALNFRNHGYSVAVYNRTEQKTREFVSKHEDIAAAYTLHDFAQSLSRPRRVFLMVTAGSAVDATIGSIAGLLSPEDVLMDGGNSFFLDTERRCGELEKLGIRFLGVGVSGGEEGALKGPCLMVGGAREGYDQVSDMLMKIAAQADGPCCQLLGPRGAGHLVKMVHNGIEYGIIQVIAEAYDILTRVTGLKNQQIQRIFDEWNNSELSSFLMEISAQVLRKRDPETGRPLVSLILDKAKQKGTGKWTSQTALDLGIPIPTIDAGVTARNLSALKEERVLAGKALKSLRRRPLAKKGFAKTLESAVRASVIVTYAQGFHLMRAASHQYGYGIPFAEVARIWKGGCIIRSKLLEPMAQAFKENGDLQNLLVQRNFARTMMGAEKSWRDLVQIAKRYTVPIPAINASLDYYDGYRSERLPANLVQALRDRFGAHGFERTDGAGDFHADWTT